MTSLNADELNQETSSKIIKQAETSYKKVLKVKMRGEIRIKLSSKRRKLIKL